MLIASVFAFKLQVFSFCVPFYICRIIIISIYNGTDITNSVYFKFCSPLIFTLGMPSSVSMSVTSVSYLCGSLLTAVVVTLVKSSSG